MCDDDVWRQKRPGVLGIDFEHKNQIFDIRKKIVEREDIEDPTNQERHIVKLWRRNIEHALVFSVIMMTRTGRSRDRFGFDSQEQQEPQT
jgi:hypothetical protein